jgi:hypothetical protein
VDFVSKDAAARGEQFRRGSLQERQVLGHFAIHAVNERLFHFIRLGK